VPTQSQDGAVFSAGKLSILALKPIEWVTVSLSGAALAFRGLRQSVSNSEEPNRGEEGPDESKQYGQFWEQSNKAPLKARWEKITEDDLTDIKGVSPDSTASSNHILSASSFKYRSVTEGTPCERS
jgi:hypothetical protein